MSSVVDSEFGVIEFVSSAKARSINVRILADKLRVSVPRRCTEKDAMKFVNSVRDKILAKQQKIKKNVAENKLVLSVDNPLQTLTFSVVLSPANRNDIFFSFKAGVLRVDFPEGQDITGDNAQSLIWNGIVYFLKKEAKRVLPGRVSLLAGENGFSYASVKIQSSKSRWGSCSQAKNINLSLYLMLLPQHLVDYVILHELCHTKEMNHGAGFWMWMDKVTGGNSKKLRAELKKYRMPE